MLALTADEAAAFCRRLQETAIGDAGRVDSLESRRFRLPTHAEWQYACRAVTTLDAAMASPHFGGWCNLQDIPPAQIQDAKDLWKKVGGVEQFTGTQDQIAKILQTAGKSPEPDERSKAIAVLEAFLRKGLGFDRPLAKVGTVHAVNSGKPNAWSIRNMHGNVFEWTITERDSEKEQQILQFLAGSQNASVPDTKCFFLAGAGYNHQLQKNPGEWVKFAVWGGEPFDVDKGIPDPLDYPSARMDSTAIDFCPGLRVVLDRVLSPGWLVVVRKTVMVPNTLDDKVHTELARVRSVATELGGTQTELAIIKYYESLANYRLGKLSDSARDVKDAAASFPDDDSYFRLLNQLVDLDATR